MIPPREIPPRRAEERIRWEQIRERPEAFPAETAPLDRRYYKRGVADELLGGKADAEDLAAHVADTGNPHGVTAAQAGADPAGTGATEAASAVSAHEAAADPHPQYDPQLRVYRSPLTLSGTFALASDTAYWVYLGRTRKAETVRNVEFYVQGAGSGAQAAEVALASSPLAPNKGDQTLTKLGSSGSLDALTSNGLKGNALPMAVSVPAGTHLWAGLRTAMATTQPSAVGLAGDFAEGWVLQTAAAGSLHSGAGPWTGSVVAATTSNVSPDLRATLD